MTLSTDDKNMITAGLGQEIPNLLTDLDAIPTAQADIITAQAAVDALEVYCPVTVKTSVDTSGGGTGETTAIATIPINGILLEVVAKVTEAFDGDATTTLEVGVAANADKYIDTVELDCTDATDWQAMTGGGSNDQGSTEFAVAAIPIIATWTNTAAMTAGAVDVYVTYLVAIA